MAFASSRAFTTDGVLGRGAGIAERITNGQARRICNSDMLLHPNRVGD
jgi:hypothetical protein